MNTQCFKIFKYIVNGVATQCGNEESDIISNVIIVLFYTLYNIISI